MTREEAKKMFREDVDSYGKPKKVMSKLDTIFNDFEKEKSLIRKENEQRKVGAK